MPDQVYDWLEAFQRFMDQGSLPGALAGMGLALVSGPLLILVHELGHALAVRARGLPLHRVKVGDTAEITVTVGAFRLELGRLLGEGDVGGYVLYDGRDATLRDVLVIAAAGPAANLAGSLATGWLALHAGVNLAVILWLMTCTGVWLAIVNLRTRGDPRDPASWSDGHWIRFARWALRTPGSTAPFWFDPNEATSVPPPGAPAAS